MPQFILPADHGVNCQQTANKLPSTSGLCKHLTFLPIYWQLVQYARCAALIHAFSSSYRQKFDVEPPNNAANKLAGTIGLCKHLTFPPIYWQHILHAGCAVLIIRHSNPAVCVPFPHWSSLTPGPFETHLNIALSITVSTL